jgi:hypothetical protein
VGYWPLDGDLVDASGNGFDGELVAGELVEEGLYGGALLCEGDTSTSFAQIPNVVPEMKKGAFSVTVWFNRTGGSGVIGAWGAADSANSWYSGHGFNVQVNSTGTVTFSNYARAALGDPDLSIVSEPGVVTDGEWTHLAVTNETIGGGRSNVVGYINGVEVGTGVDYEFIGHDTGHIVLGSRTNNGRNLFEGKIDDVALFDRVLTADEILFGIMPGVGTDIGRAHNPTPKDGETDVPHDSVVLSWTPGETAASHDVYFGEDFNDVNTATPDSDLFKGNQMETTYPLDGLTFGKTYFWRIDDINDADPNSPRKGDIWSFVTSDHRIVDDFESYNDIPAGEEGSNLVFLTWIDGYDNPSTNGSTMGYSFGASMETDIVHGGSQSAPLTYNNNTASISEVTVNPGDLEIGSDWTIDSPSTLSLWFYGDQFNSSSDRMYITINGEKRTYSGNLTQVEWQEVTVDLLTLGVDLANVTSLTIGFESSGSGKVIADDVRLYFIAP